MSDIIKDLENAMREQIKPAPPFKGAAVEFKEEFGRVLGEELTLEDMRRLGEARALIGKSMLDFALEAIRTRTAEVLDQSPGGGPA
jgi:hypothetical protein